MARSSTPSRRIKLPLLLLFLLCAVAVLFALNRVMLRPTAQVITDVPGVKLTVAQKALPSEDVAVQNQKDVNLLRFEARAEQPSGVRFTSAIFKASKGSVVNAQSYSLWVDTDNDRKVDTLLKTVPARDGLVTFDTDYLLPGAEECETNANCKENQVCTGCRCTTPGTSLKGQLVSPILFGKRCTDSDRGQVSTVKGVTSNVRLGSRTYLTWMDTCLKDWADRPSDMPADSMKLIEGYCPSSGTYGQVTYPNMLTCPLGCSDGVCKEALLRSVVLEGAQVRASYAKSFTGCAMLRDERNQPVQNGQYFCNADETATYAVTGFRLKAGQRVKLCRPNGTGCSDLVTVTSVQPASSSRASAWYSAASSAWSSRLSSSSRTSVSSSSAGPTHQDCRGPNGTIISVPIGQPCPILSSSSSSSAVSSVSRCEDSDSNAPDQFYTPGYITTKGTIHVDDCGGSYSSRGMELHEMLCSSGYPTSKYIFCPTVCVEETSPDGLTLGHCQATCGDGVKEGPNEQCDDGNTVSGDGCSATCTTEPGKCGDGIIQPSEQCDIGAPCPGGRICEIGTCLCKPSQCGPTSSSSASSSGGCTDTDGGKDYYRFGRFTNFVFGNTVLPDFSDVCFKDNNHNPSIDPNILLEGYCGDDGLGHQEQYRCPFGCENAVCLPLPASSSASSASLESCAPDGTRVYGSPVFGPTECCSRNAGIRPNSVLAGNECASTNDGSIGTCIDNWWLTCGNGTCDAGEDRCNCIKDCQGGPVCGNSKVENGEECDGSGCDTGMTCVNCRCLPTGSCGNGFVDTAPSVVFEVHADIASSFTGPQLQLQFNSIGGEDALTGRDLVGLSTNGFCNTNSQSCEMALTTADSTVFSLRKQGDLYLTLDSQTIGPRQLLAGALNEPILRVKLHAENEDIDVTGLVLTASGGLANSVDSFELWREGSTQALAVSGHCGPEYASGTFCFSMSSQQLVVPKGSDIRLLVKPRLKSDVNGAVSGDTIAVFIDSVTLPTSVRARGLISSNALLVNNGDVTAEGEIFVGRTSAAAANARIIGNYNTAVLSKIVSIANGGQAMGTVPSGTDREIGAFSFSAAPNSNTRNGLNKAELSDLIFTVNATNVALDATGFRIYNKAASMSQREMCLPYSLQGTALTGTVTGVFLVQCSMPSTSAVNSTIDSGESLTLVLLANVTNTNTAASSGGSSILQVSLNNFSDSRRTEFGPHTSMSFIRWKDRDLADTTTWTWVEYPGTAVNSTVFNG